MTLLNNCWIVLGQMSPYLIFGFLISGILSIFISPQWIERHLGGSKLAAVFKATLFGIPLPLCSCGVIPVAASLRKHGASKAATTSFLLSTPQTGADSILATWGLLGGVFAAFRPLAALITGVIGGLLVNIFDNHEVATQKIDKESPQKSETTKSISVKERVISALKYGLITLPGEIAKPLIVGVLIAGIISTFVAGNALAHYLTNYYATLIVMLLIGVPLYVCSTSSIPIAMSFIHLGVTPGAALVFLISGPATNAAAITVIWKILGRRSAFIYLMTVVLGSLFSGIAFDYMNQDFLQTTMPCFGHGASYTPNYFQHLCAVLLLLILAYSYYKVQIETPSCCQTCKYESKNESETCEQVITLDIEGMSCNNCANAINRIISEIPGVIEVQVSLHDKTALIKGNKLEAEKICQAINELGYQASERKE
ncbi:MAG: hypothetical protein Kow0029_18520 [Candidatus Rifleibacteriota bacterium]